MFKDSPSYQNCRERRSWDPGGGRGDDQFTHCMKNVCLLSVSISLLELQERRESRPAARKMSPQGSLEATSKEGLIDRRMSHRVHTQSLHYRRFLLLVDLENQLGLEVTSEGCFSRPGEAKWSQLDRLYNADGKRKEHCRIILGERRWKGLRGFCGRKERVDALSGDMFPLDSSLRKPAFLRVVAKRPYFRIQALRASRGKSSR